MKKIKFTTSVILLIVWLIVGVLTLIFSTPVSPIMYFCTWFCLILEYINDIFDDFNSGGFA